MAIPTVKIVTDPERPIWAKVWIDGQEVSGIRSVNVDMGCEKAPLVTLRIVCKLQTESVEKNGNPE